MLDKEWVVKERARLAKEPVNMDCQGGSKLDFLAFHLRNGRI
jgi:hypothetical protein